MTAAEAGQAATIAVILYLAVALPCWRLIAEAIDREEERLIKERRMKKLAEVGRYPDIRVEPEDS